MRRRSALVVLLAAVLTGASATPAGAAAPATRYHHLDPGGQPKLTETVPVNVVFLGYQPGQVDKSAFTAALAKKYEPVVRSRLYYGVTEKIGITYTYDYRVRYADAAYQNRFFRQLTALAKPAPLTEFQQAYNDQQNNVLDIDAGYAIDAPSVEKWLAFHPPAGVDTSRNTIFFINWYGRADFKFHVYTKIGEPDPDTGYDFGANRDSRKIIAWGGTPADDEETGLGATRRVWFHDLSAGPESWTSNWNVDDPDVDGDGEPDYRMPPTWEYTPGGYRAPGELTGDLAKITRFVALDSMMTASPYYPVEMPGAGLAKSINIDSNTYQGWPGVDAAAEYIKPKLLLEELADLRWRNRLDTDQQNLPYDAQAEQCYLGVLAGESCYPDAGYPSDANFYLYNRGQLGKALDDVGRVDYEVPVFNYAVAAGIGTPALGWADDDWTTGTQSYIYNFVSPEVVESGYGLTTTQIHEVGHHFGMSHPHEGYDSELALNIDPPTGDWLFLWSGDEHNSMMSYIDLNWDFSQFDRDNSDRFLTAAYWAGANRLAATIPSANLNAADALLARSAAAFATHHYRDAYALSEAAYDRVAQAARKSGVDPAAAAEQMHAEAEQVRSNPDLSHPHEFIDTLTTGPRSQP